MYIYRGGPTAPTILPKPSTHIHVGRRLTDPRRFVLKQ